MTLMLLLLSDCINVNTEFGLIVVRPTKPVQSARREEREMFRTTTLLGPAGAIGSRCASSISCWFFSRAATRSFCWVATTASCEITMGRSTHGRAPSVLERVVRLSRCFLPRGPTSSLGVMRLLPVVTKAGVDGTGKMKGRRCVNPLWRASTAMVRRSWDRKCSFGQHRGAAPARTKQRRARPKFQHEPDWVLATVN